MTSHTINGQDQERVVIQAPSSITDPPALTFSIFKKSDSIPVGERCRSIRQSRALASAGFPAIARQALISVRDKARWRWKALTREA